MTIVNHQLSVLNRGASVTIHSDIAAPEAVRPKTRWGRLRTSGDAEAAVPLASIAATLRAVALIGGGACLFALLGSFVLQLFLVALLGLLLRGLAELIARRTRVPTGAALTVVTIGIVGSAVLALYFRGPHFVAELQSLYDRISPEFTRLQDRYGNTGWGRLVMAALPNNPTHAASRIDTAATSALGTTFGLLATVIVVLLASIYVAAAPHSYVRGMVLLFPLDQRARAARVLGHCGSTLQWWLAGQAVNMLAVGVIATIGLFVLHVPLAFTLGTLAGVLTFVPYFGAWLGAVPALLMALTVSPAITLWTVAVFLLCHLVEGYLLAPFVQRRTTDLPPAVTLLAMSLIGSLYGALGLMLATPIVAAVMVVIKEGYIGAILGDAAMLPDDGRKSAP
jgi:predicted PurR-regulated permease PerM